MPAVGQRRHFFCAASLLGNDVEAALGRDLVAALRAPASPSRARMRQAIADHLVGRRHLEVELDVRQLAQPAHVLVLDVAPVLAQVHGDAVGAAEVRLDRRPHRVGLVGAPRLADGGDVVDVDAELDHSSLSSLSTARVCSACPCRRCADQRAHQAPRLVARLGARVVVAPRRRAASGRSPRVACAGAWPFAGTGPALRLVDVAPLGLDRARLAASRSSSGAYPSSASRRLSKPRSTGGYVLRQRERRRALRHRRRTALSCGSSRGSRRSSSSFR